MGTVGTAISVRGLDWRVPEKVILNGIDLEIEAGSIVAIMGMSGCGKTSLLKCMSGLRKPTSGSIFLGERDIVPIPESQMEDVRRQIGLVFQYAALFDSLTVWDNVAFGLVNQRRMRRSELDKIVKDRLAEVGMEDTEKLYPSQLSGGMQKRVGLARALATEPQALMYDEPTSGLDPVIARTIDDLIVKTRDRIGVTSVIVSHDIDSIFRIADKVAMLHEGRLIAVGTPDEMRQSNEPRVQEFLGQGIQAA
jgi:phospholipid/cholesterol/gamma-HCH transport system ATP-binding protein